MHRVLLVALLFTTTTGLAQVKEHTAPMITTIALGSCGHQGAPQPVLKQAVEQKADLFIYLGDNIYGDTEDMTVLQKKYGLLDAKPEYRALWHNMDVIATWDDHDYGINDGGKEYPKKEESKAIFLDHWRVPKEDIRRTRPGIYTSYFYEDEGHTIQVIVLDTRTFRDKLQKYRGQKVDKKAFHYRLDYWPNDNPKATMLGDAQWQWLEGQLQAPADLRIIASSTQFGISWNSYEAWANVPHEQQRMLDLIKKTKANGVIFISGDVHYGEISKLQTDGMYPIYDLTSSGITSTWKFATPNDNRIEGPVMENHLGFIKINWDQFDPIINLQIIDVEGALRINKELRLSELRF